MPSAQHACKPRIHVRKLWSSLSPIPDFFYSPRNGTGLSFFQLLYVTSMVYNLSFLLSGLLTLAGFLTCGRLTVPSQAPASLSSPTSPGWKNAIGSVVRLLKARWTLDLADLSVQGPFKIAHEASLVHIPRSDGISAASATTPDTGLCSSLILSAENARDARDSRNSGGLGLMGLSHIQSKRLQANPRPLGSFHMQIANGECALTWLVLKGHGDEGVVSARKLKRWFQDERLPSGWWTGGDTGARPSETIGLWRARRVANWVGTMKVLFI